MTYAIGASKILPAPSMDMLVNQFVYGNNSWTSCIFSHRFLFKTEYNGLNKQNTMGFKQNMMGLKQNTMGFIQNRMGQKQNMMGFKQNI